MMLIAFHWSPICSVPVVVCDLAAEEGGMGGHVTKGWDGWHGSPRIFAPDDLLRKDRGHSQFPQVPLRSTSVTAGIARRLPAVGADLVPAFGAAVPPVAVAGVSPTARWVIATVTSSRHDTSPQLVQTKCG